MSWSPTNPNLFVSGSLDKNIYLWDLRVKERHTLQFANPGVKIKHVAFDPHNENSFATGDSEGTVKIWDISMQQ